VVNSTIAFNVADSDANGSGSGGGYFGGDAIGSGRVAMDHALIAQNTVGTGGAQNCSGQIGSQGHNLIETADGCTIYGDETGNQIDVAANIAPLDDNGGPTPTHRLLADSPAIDGGSSTCGAFVPDPITVDQRGVSRPQGVACDIGAFEDACGNGTLDVGEECDDGNTLDGDCCSATCRDEPGLDVDGNNAVAVATDIVYIARYLLQLSPVPPSFRAGDPTIPDDATIVDRIEAVLPQLDVDGSGGVGVPTDIVYIARHHLVLSPVPPSFRDADPTIPSDPTIAGKIDLLCPPL
jgi:cysteine-rich repeat protein